MMMITNFSCLALYERIMRGITILCLKGLDYLRRALAARGALLLFLFLFLFLVGGKTGALCRSENQENEKKKIMVCILCEK